MTDKAKKPPLYPKNHLLAASGVAAMLSLGLLIFPSSQVEAMRTSLSLDLGASTQANTEDQDATPAIAVTTSNAASPFAQIDGSGTEKPATNLANATVTPASDPSRKSITVSNGDTLSTVFSKVGLTSNDLHEAVNSSKDAKSFSKLNVGQVLEFDLSASGQLKRLQSKLSDLESISLDKTVQGYAFKRELIKPDLRATYTRGVINSSLSQSAQRAGLSHSLTMDMASVFGYDIDFSEDIREGDEFELVYEQKVIKDKAVGTGNILSARFTNRGKTFTAVRYTNKQGSTSYYTAEGNSMRKAFIRSPVDFARISSGFSMGRRHPILNKIRAHKGIDYAAARGTPIKAAGDGRVMLAGRHGGYGNAVIIQHGNSYKTLYGHMQGFAKNVRTGSSVKQGQVIGYIGTTGLSTGPHLHYEFQVNGRHVNPLSIKTAMADPIAKAEKQRFLQQSQPLVARMDQEKSSMLALNKR
ncbi:MAG: peptidoglycan DD-metalloendopeptidase family protein [Pseudomonas sp.]|uniref:peptidoglycan DD-metalloendopeptidase family protein n=1 Tax=Pseudomonas sp. TaxID=306 RepID=UPI0027339A77|nr:peptidoglycan DD-metalloendopeptidase family protein [Pseudomonas sp.]MDP3845825.1 peptidoglycan DD-metalloendopeptidase family protein [Pseudomonas sp.]